MNSLIFRSIVSKLFTASFHRSCLTEIANTSRIITTSLALFFARCNLRVRSDVRAGSDPKNGASYAMKRPHLQNTCCALLIRAGHWYGQNLPQHPRSYHNVKLYEGMCTQAIDNNVRPKESQEQSRADDESKALSCQALLLQQHITCPDEAKCLDCA